MWFRIQFMHGGMEREWASERPSCSRPRWALPMTTCIAFRQNLYFEPDATRAMGLAFDKACRSLCNADHPTIVKEDIAKRIVDLAKEGDSDPDHLCRRTLMSLGFDPGSDSSG
jgi:hypothetical protein